MNLISKILTGLMLTIIMSSMVYAQAPDTVWTRAYGAEHHEMGECIQSTTDGNFVIAGSNHSNIRGAADI
jgi:hypothetical protein